MSDNPGTVDAIPKLAVTGPQRRPADGSNTPQFGIAIAVNPGVIDPLEIVDIQDEHRKHPSIAAGACDFPLCELDEAPPVEHPGQLVGTGKAFGFNPGILDFADGTKQDMRKRRCHDDGHHDRNRRRIRPMAGVSFVRVTKQTTPAIAVRIATNTTVATA